LICFFLPDNYFCWSQETCLRCCYSVSFPACNENRPRILYRGS
jgi:hypothetical protein